MSTVVKPGIFRHSKTGNLYEVLHVGAHTETGEIFVVYRRSDTNALDRPVWIRPVAMFVEEVFVHGEHVPRFVYVS